MKQEIEKMKSRLLLLAFILMVPIGVFAQNITVKGNVTDSEGEPIIGATVMEKGKSQNGVITDLDGNFTLKDRKSTRLNSSHDRQSRMPSSA